MVIIFSKHSWPHETIYFTPNAAILLTPNVSYLLLHPLTTQPAVEEVQARLRLIQGYHVASCMNSHEGKVALAFDLPNFFSITAKLQGSTSDLLVCLATRPFKSVGPTSITKPVANKIGVPSIDQYWNLVQNIRDETMEGLHPITSQKKVPVDIKVAPIVAVDLNTKSLHNLGLVQVIVDPAKLGVAQAAVFARHTHVVWILAGLLVGSENGTVAVDRRGNTGPDASTIVTALDQGLAAREGIVHGLASALVDDCWPASITASHGSVVFVLSQTVGETVANHDRLEIDIGLLMLLDLGRENWDVVTSV